MLNVEIVEVEWWNKVNINVLESNTKAIINPVNCEGYMGKGLAFRKGRETYMYYPQIYNRDELFFRLGLEKSEQLIKKLNK